MIDLFDIKKTYVAGDRKVEALKGVTLHIDKSDIFGVIGYSGAGKSTLVRCVNLLEKPTGGKVFVNGQEITSLSDDELRKARQKIGMIFQQFNLLQSKTVFQNVAFPLYHSMLSKKAVKEKVESLLELVGLSDKIFAYPSQLSGGQKQRVGIARALANDPRVLLSDEATSALDPQNTYSILTLLSDLNKKLGLTIVLITHEMSVIKEICNKVAVIDDGVIIEQGSSIDVFSRPVHPTTKKLIANVYQTDKIKALLESDEISSMPNNRGAPARLLFTGCSANKAYISIVSRKFKINVNVLFGNIEILQSLPVGNLFVVFNGAAGDIRAAVKYLQDEHVQVDFIDKKDMPAGKEAIEVAGVFGENHAQCGGME